MVRSLLSQPFPRGDQLSQFSEARVLVEEFGRNLLALMAYPVRRDRETVDAEYNDGRWKWICSEKNWLSCRTLRDFVIPSGDQLRIAKIGNKCYRTSDREYYSYRTAVLQEVVENLTPACTELVELGGGYGANLFALALGEKKWNRLIGLDISQNAVQAGREIASHFGLTEHISFDTLDILSGSDSAFLRLRGRAVLTYYCLEQLKHDTSLVIENILKAGPHRVIHIEPTFELLRLSSLKDLVTYLYIVRKDYQDNLLSTLKEYERKGKVKVLMVERLYYAPTVRNDPTLICWEPCL
jgi:SAM-dependent methyltransferase